MRSWRRHVALASTSSPARASPNALSGASVVVDVSNSPSFEDAAVMKFFKTSTRNLLAGEAAAGVRHHVALSVVGTGRLLQSGYLRAKFAQEKLIKESPVPYSIVQATQFFEFCQRASPTPRRTATPSASRQCSSSRLQLMTSREWSSKIATGTPVEWHR